MLTVTIPAWLQWCGIGLAIAYAIRKAIRVFWIALLFLVGLAARRWTMPEPQTNGSQELVFARMGSSGYTVMALMTAWAFKAAIEVDESGRPIVRG